MVIKLNFRKSVLHETKFSFPLLSSYSKVTVTTSIGQSDLTGKRKSHYNDRKRNDYLVQRYLYSRKLKGR